MGGSWLSTILITLQTKIITKVYTELHYVITDPRSQSKGSLNELSVCPPKLPSTQYILSGFMLT